MKPKKRRVGTQAQIKAMKERERRITTAIFLTLILLIIIISAYFTYTSLNQPQNETINPTYSHSKAAIVDQLSLTFPNQTFIETATNILEQAGYGVDYYPGEKVIVEFYRNLPTHGYGLIILRVHSSATTLQGQDHIEAPVCLFTAESYTTNKYLWKQLTDQLVIASYTMPRPPYYFAITPKFVTSSMNGKFQNATIIMMGCEGLNNTKMAEAFTEKGAKVYISWHGSVLASHTDITTTHLLQNLLIKKQTIRQAVENTTQEVGADPTYESILTYYPLKAGDQTIENIKSSEKR